MSLANFLIDVEGAPFADEGEDEEDAEDEYPVVELLRYGGVDVAHVANHQVEEGCHEDAEHIDVHPPCHAHLKCSHKIYQYQYKSRPCRSF